MKYPRMKWLGHVWTAKEDIRKRSLIHWEIPEGRRDGFKRSRTQKCKLLTVLVYV